MSDRIDQVVNDLDQVAQRAQVAFLRLSTEQLNWKSAPESWSIAQCLDHLITINRLYFPLLESLKAGPAQRTLWEKYSPLSGFLGKTLIRTLSPEYSKKTKTSSKAEPSASHIGAAIVDRFVQHQAELIAHLRQLPLSVDRKNTIITSPLLRCVTYSLDDGMTILVVHEQRHLLQAMRVMEADGFPKPV
jgi:uncharacterized damage-inducible protein DinB